MDSSNQNFIYAGGLANGLALILNAALTSAAMLGLPNSSAYDPGWTKRGFCVTDDSVVTELSASLFLVASAVAIPFFTGSKEKELKRSPLMEARVKSGTFANAAHGFGHIFIWAMGEVPPLELSLKPVALAYVLIMIGFWVGTLRMVVGVSSKLAWKMACAVLAVQYLLKVPPELAFTYSQSVILFTESSNLLIRKEEYSKEGILYFAASVGFLPLFALFYFETKCNQSFLSMLGGHSLYDLYLSLQPFIMYYFVTGMKQKKL